MFPILMTLPARICQLAVLLLVTGAISVASASAQEEAAKPVGTPRVAPPQPSSPAAPSGQTISSAENDYVLSAGDTIDLSVFREPDLTSRSTIARDGSVQLPLIREVKLAGMTVRDARTFLTKLYGEKYLVNPQVYLSVSEFAQRKFTIMGQVSRPGSYELQGGQSLDLLEAIGMAGGFTRIADRGHVIIRRGNGGDKQVFKLNAKGMAEGKTEMFEILPGDIITVGESWF